MGKVLESNHDQSSAEISCMAHHDMEPALSSETFGKGNKAGHSEGPARLKARNIATIIH